VLGKGRKKGLTTTCVLKKGGKGKFFFVSKEEGELRKMELHRRGRGISTSPYPQSKGKKREGFYYYWGWRRCRPNFAIPLAETQKRGFASVGKPTILNRRGGRHYPTAKKVGTASIQGGERNLYKEGVCEVGEFFTDH